MKLDRKTYQRKYQKEHRQEISAKVHIYYLIHRQEKAEYNRKYRLNHKKSKPPEAPE